ncbi:putative ferric-chelate reductase 1 homolog isoform X1 [Parasteatoda tepidariorum]|uniref:putative ferric-chelate reductase 1 homolog isoform X1 n=2 Tax=Parasteatoda tepidariorum TaxID=114398 RepID=UPI00077FCEDE|nr:putative ferric-chelate reductase 1 homolog isoform X2 [Parasteatoda tepidariorum]
MKGFSMISEVFVLLIAVLGCNARPEGAPSTACSSLVPRHSGIEPQRSPSPYTVTAVKSGNKVRVTISSQYGEEIEGFALQARSKRDRSRLVDGKFSVRDGISKTIDCLRGKQNTLTQVNPSSKREIITEWTPNENEEEVVFRATVAKSFAVFWTEVDSPPVRLSNMFSTSQPSKTENLDSQSMYSSCFATKGCFGYPSGCIPRTDCEILLSYVNRDDGIYFQMHGYLEPNTYMAMGISTDSLMGDDTVTECFRQGSMVHARESWNNGGQKSNGHTRELPRSSYDGEYRNGLTTCSWTERYIKDAYDRSFNLANSTYYLLLAKGPITNGRIGYHDGRIASQEPVNFKAFDAIMGEGVSDSIKIHGTFMVTAWVGFVSIGILLARHFKSSWDTKTMCGVKVWFALHRSMMITGLIFVVIAFIVIFVHKDGWNYATKNPHAILGCIATGLGLLQPIMAAFRPSPEDSKRPLFNLFHWLVGNTAHLIAIITIFFAVSLESSGLKESFYWVMAIFVVLHLLFHFLFQMIAWSASKKKNEMKMMEMSSRTGNNTPSNDPEKNQKHDAFRVLLFCVYSIFLVIVLLVLYSLIGIA